MESRLRTAFEAATAAKTIPGVGAIAVDRSGNVLFKGVYGTTHIGDPDAPAMTSSTPLMIWSCTKVITSIAALQLMEQGKLALDDPVEQYLPEISKIQVLEGIKDGVPVLRAPKTKPTILNLMTHTAGFSYDLFDPRTYEWRNAMGQEQSPYLGVGARQNFDTPFIFDPGSRYAYGVNTDWLGFVVEAVSGVRLNEYIKKNILQPLGMNGSGTHPKKDQKKLVVHHRDAGDRSLTPNPALAPATDPEQYGGGHYLYSTLDDYSSLLLTLLNYGTHPGSKVKILEEATAREYLFKDQIPKICSNEGIGVIKSANHPLTSEGEFLPGVSKGWSCGFMVNHEAVPKGRSAGSGSWAGLGNLYYWVDPDQGKAGLIMSQILPFMDREILHLFDELERAVYGHEPAKEMNEAGGNYTTVL